MIAAAATTRPPGRLAAGIAAAWFGAVVTVSDMLPPRFRYGYAHRLTGLLYRRPLPALTATKESSPMTSAPTLPATARTDSLTCVLLTGSMDVGGIGSVVEVLAGALPVSGVRPVVISTHEGARATRLRERGVEVIVSDSARAAERVLRDLAPQVVQLHGAPEHLEEAAIASGLPLVPVLHNTEIHYSRKRWVRFARLLSMSITAIAVSELVRDFHARHVAPALAARIEVIGNAIPAQPAPTADERCAARNTLAQLFGADLEEMVVFACLARFDSQKNVAGLVASFLNTVTDPRALLVVAGEPSDWAEMRRADAIRRCSPRADRVKLLASSDARALLAAADAFILDSFFEGWPVAATEAEASGLPLILGDFGGGRELVARDPEHSLLIENACGAADKVSDAAVARARRRCRRQSNASALGRAIDLVTARVRAGKRPAPVATSTFMDTMIEGHARVLRDAVAGNWGEVDEKSTGGGRS